MDTGALLLPRLSVELTDAIIDHLASNLHDDLLIPARRYYRPHILGPLIACSSVSKAFHNRTSHHIFSSIILTETDLSGNTHDNNPRKQTIAGLLDILDNSGHDDMSIRVHTLKLYTAPTRLPAKCAWSEVDDAFPTILHDPFLPRVLKKLTSLRSLHLVHRYPEPFRYPNVSEEMNLGIHMILRGQYLSRLEVLGFSELPISLLANCLHLVEFAYHEYTWGAENIASVPKAKFYSGKSCNSLSFTLQHATFTGYNMFVEELIAGGALSKLKTFKHNLNGISDIFVSSRIMYQASSSLETVHISRFNAKLFMNEINDCPIDLSCLSCLREIAISSFGYVGSHGTQLLRALCLLLGAPGSPFHSPSRINSAIEIVRLDIRCGSATFKRTTERNHDSWDDLDVLLNTGPLFRRLKEVEVRIGIIIEDVDRARIRGGEEDVCQLGEEISDRINNLFGSLRAHRGVKLTILVDYPFISSSSII